MRQWLASQGFGSVMIAVWSLYVMFVAAAGLFGFNEVTGALGDLGDRFGFVATEVTDE